MEKPEDDKPDNRPSADDISAMRETNGPRQPSAGEPVIPLSVGRIVHYFPQMTQALGVQGAINTPFAAIVTAVHPDMHASLSVFLPDHPHLQNYVAVPWGVRQLADEVQSGYWLWPPRI